MSYKEILKQQQPILYQIISKSFKNNKIPHAFLLVGKNARQPAHFIAIKSKTSFSIWNC